jgi:hypothetical protein
MKKILVSLPDGIVEILDKEIIGKFGEGYSDTLRSIIMNWMSEQGYLAKNGRVNDDVDTFVEKDGYDR